jgi:hypothetical protein
VVSILLKIREIFLIKWKNRRIEPVISGMLLSVVCHTADRKNIFLKAKYFLIKVLQEHCRTL